MRPYNEVRTGNTNGWEILLGTLLGAACAVVAIWFATVLVFSLQQ